MNKRALLIIGVVICLVAGIAVFIINNKPEEEIVVNEEFEQEVRESMKQDETEHEDLTVNDLTDSQDYYSDGELLTLEEALPVLIKAGYKKTKDGYIGKDSGDGVVSERKITAKGDHVKADLSYDYGSGNKEMTAFFKENPDNAVSIMLSSILVVIADAANSDSGSMDYTIRVGGKKVADGKMTVDKARYYQSLSLDD